MPEAWIVDAVRTPRGRGRSDGALAAVHPQDLAATCLDALVRRNGLSPAAVDDVLLGCVNQVGEQGRDIARAAVLAAGWPVAVPGVSLNRFCASGLTAVTIACAMVTAGHADLVVAGGVESMSRVPMGSDPWVPSPSVATRFPDLTNQGLAADSIARRHGVSRAELDRFALDSQRRVGRAIEEGRFARSLVAVPLPPVEGEVGARQVLADEHPRPQTTLAALAGLKPAFAPDGLHTAGSSSGIVDGAGAVLVASASRVRELGLRPRARIVAAATAGDDPVTMLLGPIPSTRRCLERWGGTLDEIDVVEVNEAFAVVPIVVARELCIDPDRVNPNGGAIALGHPIGATGAILVGTLIDELDRREASRGLVTLCTRFGMGETIVLQRMA